MAGCYPRRDDSTIIKNTVPLTMDKKPTTRAKDPSATKRVKRILTQLRPRRPQTRSERQGGAETVARTLHDMGIRSVFTVGGAIFTLPLLHASQRRGLKCISSRDEATAVYAACANAQVQNAPEMGVAVLDTTGLASTMSAIKHAQEHHAPLLLLLGTTAMVLKGRGAAADFDYAALLKHHVKAVEVLTLNVPHPKGS